MSQLYSFNSVNVKNLSFNVQQWSLQPELEAYSHKSYSKSKYYEAYIHKSPCKQAINPLVLRKFYIFELKFVFFSSIG